MPIGHGFDGKDWDKVIESLTTIAKQLKIIEKEILENEK